jgi:hypothetical protein
MGRYASGPGRADGAVAFIQVACSIHRGYTSQFPGYTSKATMLLVSEAGARRKKQDKRGKTSCWTFDVGVRGIIWTINMPGSIFLGCIEFRKSSSARRPYPLSYPSAFNPRECGRFGCCSHPKKTRSLGPGSYTPYGTSMGAMHV